MNSFGVRIRDLEGIIHDSEIKYSAINVSNAVIYRDWNFVIGSVLIDNHFDVFWHLTPFSD